MECWIELNTTLGSICSAGKFEGGYNALVVQGNIVYDSARMMRSDVPGEK